MKINFFLITIFFPYFLFSLNKLPVPKDYKLYTEFTCYKKMKYLKKESISTGYIAMNGKDKFIYKQLTPFVIEIRKKESKIYYKKEKMDEIIIDISENNQLEFGAFFVFNSEDSKLQNNFIITKNSLSNFDYYEIIPKNSNYIEKIKAKGNLDILYEILIIYKDGSVIKYEFKNTKTGIEINEQLF